MPTGAGAGMRHEGTLEAGLRREGLCELAPLWGAQLGATGMEVKEAKEDGHTRGCMVPSILCQTHWSGQLPHQRGPLTLSKESRQMAARGPFFLSLTAHPSLPWGWV